jgi:putative ABC transport system substrate-binding protein
MNRRQVAVMLGGLPLAMPRIARAQQTERIRRIGYLTPTGGSPENVFGVLQTRALVEALRNLGWFDGRNVTVDHRFTGSGQERIQRSAAELVASNPDVIDSVGGAALAALLAATHTIPIVFTNVGDAVAGGFVTSLARPGGNLTGVTTVDAPIAGKWAQLLKEIAPQTVRVTILMEPGNPTQRLEADAVIAAAPGVGLTAAAAGIIEIGDYEREIGAAAREPGGALVVLPNVVANNNLDRIQRLAARHRLPAVYSFPIYARYGGLISYGPDNLVLIRQAAGYLDKILRGARPGDLPVEQPTRFVLAVNMRTAKALGLTVPQSLLAQADEVIE